MKQLPWRRPKHELPKTSEFKLTTADVRVDANGTAHITVADCTITDSNFDTREWQSGHVILCIHARGVAPCELGGVTFGAFIRMPGRWGTS
jgi:hypothetical protein